MKHLTETAKDCRLIQIYFFWNSDPTKDNNELAEKVCKGRCIDLKRNCGQMLGCGDVKFDVSKHCPETCGAPGNFVHFKL